MASPRDWTRPTLSVTQSVHRAHPGRCRRLHRQLAGPEAQSRGGSGYVARVAALVLVALSVGLDNFGAATAIGVSGVDATLRLRIALIFGFFEGAMPLLGLLLGHSVAHDLGTAATPLGGALLGLVGAYAVASEFVNGPRAQKNTGYGVTRLVLLGAALSIDNLVIGFALGAYRVDLLVAAITIALVSVGLSLLGLEIGHRLGARLGRKGELVGGIVLILVGIGIGTGLL
jgi:manganese efflux pump family protein